MTSITKKEHSAVQTVECSLLVRLFALSYKPLDKRIKLGQNKVELKIALKTENLMKTKHRHPVPASRFLLGAAKLFYGNKYFTKRCKLTCDGALSAIKPPYIVVANHAGFADVGGLEMLAAPDYPSFVISVTQLVQWPSLIRRMGVLPKKQFTVDTSLVRDIKYILDKGRSVAIYPEAKLSVVGTPNIIKPSVAKLVRLLKVPLVTVRFNGTYLHKPRWAHGTRFVPLHAEVRLAVTPDEVGKLSVDEIHNRIVTNLAYDDYAYQLANKICIDVPDLCEGLEGILYKCPECGAEYAMTAHGNKLQCGRCGATVTQDEYGALHGGRFDKVTDWYAWQTECVREELTNGTYRFEDNYLCEKLVGQKYVTVGEAVLTHDETGLTATIGETKMFYKRDSMYTLSFNNDYVFLPTAEAVYRFKRTANLGENAKLNIAIEQQSLLDELK